MRQNQKEYIYMYLAEIPQILSLLTDKGVLTDDQKALVLEEIEAMKEKGESAFAGEIAISLGFTDQDTVNCYLNEQAARKAEACVKDIQDIIKANATLEAPDWLKPNWGNNGVNPFPEKITISDGVSSAANVSQNMVMLANAKPEIASNLQEAIIAAANLARGILNGDSERVPLSSKAGEWIKDAEDGLRYAVKKTGITPTDRGGKHIQLEDFITARIYEIEKGVELSLARGQDKVKTI